MREKEIYLQGKLSDPYHLIETEDLFIIRFKVSKTGTSFFAEPQFDPFRDQLQELASFPNANAYVYKCLAKINGIRDEIKNFVEGLNDPRVHYIGSIFCFKDSDIFQIYTNNIFLKFEPSFSDSEIKQFLVSENLDHKLSLNFAGGSLFVEAPKDVGSQIFEYCKSLLLKPFIQLCHPELVTSLHQPNRRLFQSTDRTVNLRKDWWLRRVGLDKAMLKSKGATSVIAVIDDGLDFKHPAFKNKIVAWRDMRDKTNSKKPVHKYDEGHGTACASVALSNDPNAPGVAPLAKLIPIRITGLGSVLQAEAIYWAVNQGADIISCSWGPPDGNISNPSDDNFHFPLPDHTRLAFAYAAKYGRNGKGCAIVFAAGNGNEPAKHDGYVSNRNVFAISAVNYKNRPTQYSDYGKPIICAFPSGDFDLTDGNEIRNASGIQVADRIGKYGFSPNNYYALFTGTSASCPGVAGIIALLYDINPNLHRNEIRTILMESCEKIGPPSSYDINDYNIFFGHGLIRADLAVRHQLLNKPQKKVTMKQSNSIAISLHIGINEVDSSYYGTYVPPLYGCVNDMNKMEQFASGLGYESHTLENEQATKAKICSQIIQLGNKVQNGGILLITYAGHGAPIPNNPLEEDEGDTEDTQDGYDEAWVSYDGFILDDELFECFSEIDNEIRVVLVSDSCHSESMSRIFQFQFNTNVLYPRSIDRGAVFGILNRNGQTVSSIRKGIRSKDTLNYQVFVKALAACGKDETAQEKNGAGVYTSALLKIYNRIRNIPTTNYASFVAGIKEEIHMIQTPNVTNSHNKSPIFDGQFPFEINPLTPGDEDKGPNQENQDKKIGKNDPRSNYFSTSRFFSFKKPSNKSDTGSTAREVSQHKIERNFRAISVWDQAYDSLLNEEQKDIDYIEPDIISDLYVQNTEESSRSVYLDTYPPRDGDEVPFDWHLGDEFTQLKSAREHVFPNLAINDISIPDGMDQVKIGHIDTGIIPYHKTLPAYLEQGTKFSMTGEAGLPFDTDVPLYFQEQQGHGNATAALLSGKWINYSVSGSAYFKGFFGANPCAKVLPIKISETVGLLSGIVFAQAVRYAIDEGCDVITMSMAGLPSKVMANAVNLAYESGVVIVSAASNSFAKGGGRILPKKTLYPARYDRVISAVGATYNHKPYLFEFHNKLRASGKKYMQTCFGPSSALPTSIAAYTPNIIWFSLPENEGFYTSDGGGTSSATPQVAAAASLYIQKYREELKQFKGKNAWKKAEIVRQALFRSAHKMEMYSHIYGQGILKANRALDPEFSPSKLKSYIKKQDPAPEKKKFLNGLFGLLLGRSANQLPDNQIDSIQDMMRMEIAQLLHVDENLMHYLDEVDIDSEVLDLSYHPDLVRDIQHSAHASQFLKSNLGGIFPSETRNIRSGNLEQNSVRFESHLGDINIRASGLGFNISNKVSYEEEHESELYWIDEFDIEVSGQASGRSSEINQIEILVDQVETPTDVAMLLEKQFEDGSVLEWQFDQDTINTINNQGANSLDSNRSFRFRYEDLVANDRSLGKRLKRVIVKIYKSIIKEKKGGNKTDLIARLLDTKYALRIFDLSDGSNNKWQDADQVGDSIFKKIQESPKPLLVFVSGLFVKVEKAYRSFLLSKSNREKLLEDHCPYILGLNMPTVAHGIEENANHLSKLIKQKFKNKPCHVLAKSRGGLVIRFLSEITWMDNRTNKMLKSAPLSVEKLIMFGTPNQGTKIASYENWRSLLNTATNVSKLVFGRIAPIIPGIMSIIKAIGLKMVELPGISDLEEGSELCQRLNMMDLNRNHYFVFTSNFEPKGFFKKLFDNNVVDKAIFSNDMNDSITPVLGALFLNKDYETKVILDKDQYRKSAEDELVSHFKYLDPDHNKITEKLFDLLHEKKNIA